MAAETQPAAALGGAVCLSGKRGDRRLPIGGGAELDAGMPAVFGFLKPLHRGGIFQIDRSAKVHTF